MKQTTYQHPELRDANDNIIQQGAFGKNTALANATNDGWIDYVANDLEALYNNINGSRIYVANKAALPTTGDLSAMYIAEDTGKWYLWDGQKYIETDNARKIADEAIAARDAAKASANDAANSAREQQADWAVTDSTSKAFVKNKPEVLTYKYGNYQQTMEWESNCVQYVAAGKATDHPEAYSYGVQVTLGKIEKGANARLYFPCNGGMYLKNFLKNYNDSGWRTMIDDKNFTSYALPKDGTAVKATADAAGNNIQNTYVKKSDLASSLSTKALTVSGETSVPTANEGNSSKAIANTEYVQGELTNYLPLSGGTLTGVVNGVTPPNGDNSKKLATTEFVNAKAENYLPLRGGTLTGAINTANKTWNKLGDDASFGDYNIGGKMCIKTQTARNTGIAFFDQSDTNVGEVEVNNAFNFNKPVKENGGFLVPIGVVQAFAGSTIPTGWLLCDGSAVSRTDYAALYAVIGTTYGAGNGSTTFNLPNLVDKFVEGSATAGKVKSAGLPNITGSFGLRPVDGGLNVTWETNSGAIKVATQTGDSSICVASSSSKAPLMNVTIDASRSSAIYGKSDTVQPPALTMRYIIKY